MSIRYSYHIGFVALLLLLAACTQDELVDDTRLPEGQYPLQIAAVTLSVEGGEAQPWGAPQTRVSENGDGTGSKWDGDEEIGMQIKGSTETATYTVQADGTVSSNAPLYWSDCNTHTVNAWYPATDGTLDLSDQATGGTITECTSSAIVEGTNSVGGVAGQTDNGATLTACYATDDVTVKRDTINNTYAGGVVGSNSGGSALIACYATGNVTVTGTGTGSIYVGGVTGDNFASTLTACYHAAGTVSGPDGATGGVAGRNFNDASGTSVITACYWQNDQAQGIGYNQPNTGETTLVADGNWTNAMNAMNNALSGTVWKYVSGSGNEPLMLQKVQ